MRIISIFLFTSIREQVEETYPIHSRKKKIIKQKSRQVFFFLCSYIIFFLNVYSKIKIIRKKNKI